MNGVKLNQIWLNSISLNGMESRIGGKSAPKAPEGAEVFRASDGPLMASDGVFYVKKEII